MIYSQEGEVSVTFSGKEAHLTGLPNSEIVVTEALKEILTEFVCNNPFSFAFDSIFFGDARNKKTSDE